MALTEELTQAENEGLSVRMRDTLRHIDGMMEELANSVDGDIRARLSDVSGGKRSPRDEFEARINSKNMQHWWNRTPAPNLDDFAAAAPQLLNLKAFRRLQQYCADARHDVALTVDIYNRFGAGRSRDKGVDVTCRVSLREKFEKSAIRVHYHTTARFAAPVTSEIKIPRPAP